MYSPVGGNKGIHTYKGIHTIDFYIVYIHTKVYIQ